MFAAIVAATFAASEVGDFVSQHDFQRVAKLLDEVQARMSLLLSDNAALRSDNAALRSDVDSLQARVDTLQANDMAHTPSTSPRGADASAADGHSIQQGRRLTGSSTYLGVNALQIHEFPSGHTCANTGFVESNPMLLGVDSSGPTLKGGISLASADVSFASIGAKDYDASEVQRFPGPLKVVHDSSCSASPTLHFGLSAVGTSLALDSLTVGGSAVSGGGASWTVLPFYGGNQVTYHGEMAYYTKIGGMVCMSGGVKKTSGSAWAMNDFIATLPADHAPCWNAFIPGVMGENTPGTFKVDQYGNVQMGNPGGGQTIAYLFGACFKAC